MPRPFSSLVLALALSISLGWVTTYERITWAASRGGKGVMAEAVRVNVEKA